MAQIAFSKINNKPIYDLDQFLQLPRAICDTEGIPEKGKKSSAVSVFKSLYQNWSKSELGLLLIFEKAICFSQTGDNCFLVFYFPFLFIYSDL
jgi:hypothetical protein